MRPEPRFNIFLHRTFRLQLDKIMGCGLRDDIQTRS
jgi:hypothetical protein